MWPNFRLEIHGGFRNCVQQTYYFMVPDLVLKFPISGTPLISR